MKKRTRLIESLLSKAQIFSNFPSFGFATHHFLLLHTKRNTLMESFQWKILDLPCKMVWNVPLGKFDKMTNQLLDPHPFSQESSDVFPFPNKASRYYIKKIVWLQLLLSVLLSLLHWCVSKQKHYTSKRLVGVLYALMNKYRKEYLQNGCLTVLIIVESNAILFFDATF